ncbi:hypothetical protein J7F01_11215 [Streptomyces sp. ISL-22]|uniref:hypothetical protein n=1 Tax=unclassified Streptomyces TaxID=2593676 RepID=UPI001BED22CC|nr:MULTISPECIES: hypothetical protein [unclassified Streptomyces]MBT2421107.1 hypothetical protein [Streptomyces sp. ISL-24]MBT2432750.1 hypothetical protein [Streptomyces sp. ISL-22]
MTDVGHLAELRGLERTVLTVTTPHHPTWLPVFPVAHLAEHLLGRELGRLPGLSALTGHLRRDLITVRFLTATAGPAAFDVRQLVDLRETARQDFEQERRVLAVEDAILPPPLRTAGRLPASLAEFLDAWRRTEPRPRLERQPYLTDRLRELVDPAAPPHPYGTTAPDPGPADPRQEHAKALAAVRRRTGGTPPELFLDGGPLEQYCGAGSVFLAGLSAYRSPLFRGLREGPRPLYTLKLFDFPWRRRTFIACVTQPAIGPAEFAATLGARTVGLIAGLDDADLRTVLTEGRVAVLDDLTAVLDFPPRRAWLPVLARLNGFSARPADLARPVLDCTVDDLARYRDTFLDAYARHIHRTAREAV